MRRQLVVPVLMVLACVGVPFALAEAFVVDGDGGDSTTEARGDTVPDRLDDRAGEDDHDRVEIGEERRVPDRPTTTVTTRPTVTVPPTTAEPTTTTTARPPTTPSTTTTRAPAPATTAAPTTTEAPAPVADPLAMVGPVTPAEATTTTSPSTTTTTERPTTTTSPSTTTTTERPTTTTSEETTTTTERPATTTSEETTTTTAEEATTTTTTGAEEEATPAARPERGDGDIVCPVRGEATFRDSWGAARSGGRRRHKGVDMMADEGTPTVAPVDGTVEFTSSSLGGLSWWVEGDDGDRYYGAHLSATEGEEGRVTAGTVIGYVGETGNAQGPHLHFQVHPGGGEAVNPYPYVAEAC